MTKFEITRASQIRKAIAETKTIGKRTSYSITGFKGLELQVRFNKGLDSVAEFRHRYTHPITGKRPYMTLGQYPALSLADARKMHIDNMALLAKSIDPIEKKQLEKKRELLERKNTLNYFINEWQELQDSKKLGSSAISKNETYVLLIRNGLGNMKVTEITPSIVIQFINNIQKQNIPKGQRVKSVLSSVLQLAFIHGVIEYNPAKHLNGALKTHTTTHLPAITDPNQFAKLLKDIDSLDDAKYLYNKSILQLLALTFVRIADACEMKWADIDWSKNLWNYEQKKAGKRDDMQASIVVPLAPQTIAILRQMQKLTGDQEYVFYSSRRRLANYHNKREVNKVLNSDLMNDGQGYKDIHSPHGFRASAKTMLTERLGFDEVYTELQLGHKMLNKYGNAYNRMEGLEQRKHMMTVWANYLDDIKAGKIDNVIYTSFKDRETKQG